MRFAVLAMLIGEMKRGLMNAVTATTTTISRNRLRSFFSMTGPSVDAAAGGELHDHLLAEPVAGQDAADRAFMHHRYPVADADDLLQVAGDHQDGDAAIRQTAYQLIDFRLGADVHAAR